MCSSVSVVNVDRISPDPSPPAANIPLSFFDTYWIALPPIQRLFLYPNLNSNNKPPFSSVVQSLKSSLSKTLAKFSPFAGTLAYLPSDSSVVLLCDKCDGVEFVTSHSSSADFGNLVADDVHHTLSFMELVPELEARELPAKVMAVKVTGFEDGGVAVGVAMHHAVADGNAVWQFLDAWAQNCRGGEEVYVNKLPVHDRKLIVRDGGHEIAKRFLKQVAPELPRLAAQPLSMQQRLTLQRRTFAVSSSAIQSLKQRITTQSDGPDTPPSTFTSISAHAWLCFARAHARALSPNPADVTVLLFLADCRSRLIPPLLDSYAGNCVSPCYGHIAWADLLGPDGLARAQADVARAAQEGTRDPLRRCESWREDYLRLPQSALFVVSGSPRFRAYDTDFGWGKPGRVELVSMNKDGEMVLVAGKELGSVQASVSLDPVRMAVFAEEFVAGLDE